METVVDVSSMTGRFWAVCDRVPTATLQVQSTLAYSIQGWRHELSVLLQYTGVEIWIVCVLTVYRGGDMNCLCCLCCTFLAPDEQLFSVNLQVRRQVKKTNVYMFQVQKNTYFWKFRSLNRSWQKKRMSNYQSYSSFRISQIGATLTCRQYWVAFRTFWHKFSQQKICRRWMFFFF